MHPDIPDDQLTQTRARVDQLLKALRRATDRLPSEADSALIYRPETGERPEMEEPE